MGKRAEKITPAETPTRDPRTLGRADWLIAVGLFATTFLLYIPSYSHPFVDLDDPKYIHDNPIVQRGLSLEGVRWAFTTNQFANWLPVTWLSHMLDCQIYGMNAQGHHVTNGLLHALNAALVFLVVRMLAGSEMRVRSLAVAALFTVHPLRVESVSWIAERKDVLCAFFFLLTLGAYVFYVRRPSIGRYAAMFVLYALGLMSKTMIVTLPCVLLLLDFWPLKRFENRRRTFRVIVEKTPLFVLAAVSSAWTMVLQQSGGALSTGEDFTLGQRFGNAVVSIPRYLAKMVRPVELSPFYTHPGSWPIASVVASIMLIVAISVAVIVYIRRTPYLAVGWFWFLGMLVPVSGFAVQAGGQAMADRYTYLPGIGLLIAVVWGIADLARTRPQVRSALKPVAIGLVALFAFASVLQQRYWASTQDLFEHAVAVDPDNWFAHGMLGIYASNTGDETTALAHYEKALETKQTARLWLDSGMSLYALGRTDEAIERYRKALATKDGARSALVHYQLGNALARKNQREEAAKAFNEALRLDSSNKGAREALNALATQ